MPIGLSRTTHILPRGLFLAPVRTTAPAMQFSAHQASCGTCPGALRRRNLPVCAGTNYARHPPLVPSRGHPIRRWQHVVRASPDKDTSTTPRKQQSSPEPDDEEPKDGITSSVARFVELLIEFGGIYGTIAVVTAFFAKIDPFGNFHIDTNDMLFGLKLFLPVMIADAAILLPDYSTDHSKARQLSKVFLGDLDKMIKEASKDATQPAEPTDATSSSGSTDIAAASTGAEGTNSADSTSTSASSSSSTPASTSQRAPSNKETASSLRQRLAAARAKQARDEQDEQDDQEMALGMGMGMGMGTPSKAGSILNALTEATYAAAQAEAEAEAADEPSDSTSGSGSSAGVSEPWKATSLLPDRVKVSLDILQNHILRNNPAVGISPPQEAFIVVVGSLAEEMLYRAVVLLLLSYWLRDRLYEAGADDDVLLATGQLVATPDLAKALAVGVTALLGVAAFAWTARSELRMLKNMQVVASPEGKGKVDTEAIKAQLVESMGMQNALVWLFEGSREVASIVASGTAFFLTGNLAASWAGGLLSQALLSAYQRLGYQRLAARRARLMQRMEGARQRALEKLQEKVKAAEAAEAAEAAARGGEAGSSGEQAKAAVGGDEGGYVSIFGQSTSSNGSSSAGSSSSGEGGSEASGGAGSQGDTGSGEQAGSSGGSSKE